jgi:hypothetical protein
MVRLVAASLVVILFTACGSEREGGTPEPLDERANVACAAFDQLATEYESLDKQKRRDLVFEMWDEAQFSETTGIRRIGRKVVEVVSAGRVAARAKVFDDMRLACRGLASPYRTIGSND